MELEGYSQATCNQLCASSNDVLVGVNLQARRPSTSSVDNAVDLPWRNFLSQEFGGKVREGSILIFWRYLNFLKTQNGIGQRKLPSLKPALSQYPSSRFNTILVCDGQTNKTTAYTALA